MLIAKEKNKSLIVRLMGGLGNQMFQYAFAYAIARKYNYNLFIDKSFLLMPVKKGVVKRDFELDIFPSIKISFVNKWVCFYSFGLSWMIPINLIEQIKRRLPFLYMKWQSETHFHFNKFSQSVFSESLLISGFWQSYKYFQDYNTEISNIYSIPISDFASSLYNEIKQSQSVCINIRRTDFLVNPTHGVCDINYYVRAIDLLEKKIGLETRKYIFSDDLEWCKTNLKFSNSFFVEHLYKGDRFSQYLALMKSCKHFIIANSSFAWWAAYLGEYKDKVVIAPRNWFADPSHNTEDIYLPDWIIV
jgi:hypothetical protein